MKDVCERLLELLGKSPRTRVVRTFLNEIGHRPIIEKLGPDRIYLFPDLGFRFYYTHFSDHIFDVQFYFHHEKDDIYNVDWRSHNGRLLGCIDSCDTQSTVQEKLGKMIKANSAIISRSTGPHYDSYFVPPFEYSFSYDRASKEIRYAHVMIKNSILNGFSSMKGGSKLANLGVLRLAHQESHRLGFNFVGTDMILLGLLVERSHACAALEKAGVRLDEARTAIEKILGRGTGYVEDEPSFTPRAKHVLETALRLSRLSRQELPSSEQILIAVLDEGGGVALRALANLHIDLSSLRQDLVRLL